VTASVNTRPARKRTARAGTAPKRAVPKAAPRPMLPLAEPPDPEFAELLGLAFLVSELTEAWENRRMTAEEAMPYLKNWLKKAKV
jgi:hypothetical protein